MVFVYWEKGIGFIRCEKFGLENVVRGGVGEGLFEHKHHGLNIFWIIMVKFVFYLVF